MVLRDPRGTPPAHRLTALTSRLAGVRHHLEVARDVLTDMPRVHVETAVTQTRGLVGMLAEVETLAALDAGLAPALRRARDDAADALCDHADWLEAQLPVSD